MGNIIAKAKENGVEFAPPENVKEIEAKIKECADKPSEGLQKIWLNIKTGYFNEDWMTYIAPPFTYANFAKDNEGDGFEGFSEVEGKKAFHVCTLWSDTDSRTLIYEMLEGEYKGTLISFPFSDIKIYHSGKTCEQFLETIAKVNWSEPDESQDFIFNDFFTDESEKNKKSN